jgi:hypothetical protein
MKKFKVYMPSGTIQTIVANSFNVEWRNENVGILRFTIDDAVIAIFPPGGWHGVQDVEVYKKATV